MDPAGIERAARVHWLCQKIATGSSSENHIDRHHGAHRISFVTHASVPNRLITARRRPIVNSSSAIRRARRAAASAATISVRTSTANTLIGYGAQGIHVTCSDVLDRSTPRGRVHETIHTLLAHPDFSTYRHKSFLIIFRRLAPHHAQSTIRYDPTSTHPDRPAVSASVTPHHASDHSNDDHPPLPLPSRLTHVIPRLSTSTDSPSRLKLRQVVDLLAQVPLMSRGCGDSHSPPFPGHEMEDSMNQGVHPVRGFPRGFWVKADHL